MFKEWREQLTKEEKEILNYIYSYWQKHNDWPNALKTAVKFRKKIELFDFGKNISHRFVNFCDSNRKDDKFILTIYGIALCDNSEKDVNLFLKILNFCIQKYIKNPIDENITSNDIQKQFNLQKEEIYKIYHFLDSTRIWGGASQNQDGSYSFNLSYRILKYEDIKNLDEYYNIADKDFLPIRFGGKEEPFYGGYVKTIDSKEYDNRYDDEIEPYQPIEVNFIKNQRIKSLVENDLKELHYVLKTGAWKSSTILAASIAESLLLDIFEKNEKIAIRTMKNRWPNKVTLYDMVTAASRSGLISEPEEAVFGILRIFRNQIHPQRAMNEKRPDEYIAFALTALVQKLIKDVQEINQKGEVNDNPS